MCVKGPEGPAGQAARCRDALTLPPGPNPSAPVRDPQRLEIDRKAGHRRDAAIC
jgi:hypothetical protein